MKKLLLIVLFLISIFTPSVSFAAIQASTVWEFRQSATASMVNGGGYTSGGTDYSQQDAAQLNNTDFATSGIGVTTLTSVTGGLTAAMVGNIIHLTAGTNLIVGWYEITARTDTNTVTLDRAPDDGVGGVSTATGYVGGALSLNSTLDDEFFEQCEPGNKIYFKYSASSYVPGENIAVLKDGTVNLPIIIEGYNATRGDYPLGANRPTIAAGGTQWSFDNFWQTKHFIFTTSHADGIDGDNGLVILNCKITGSGGGGTNALRTASDSFVINCEISGVGGTGDGLLMSDGTKILYSYIHDLGTGFNVKSNNIFIGNIIDTCLVGINIDNNDGAIISNNTIYNCTTGISGTTGSHVLILNNILDANTTGVNWTNTEDVWLDYNVWDNTADVSGVSKGPHAVTGDPGLTDPANGDFTLGSGSNAIDAGMQVGTNQGAVGDYKWNAGVDQDDVTAAGGGGSLSVSTNF